MIYLSVHFPSDLRTSGSHRDRQGIHVVRYDHPEPQSGKDVCDRICVLLRLLLEGIAMKDMTS